MIMLVCVSLRNRNSIRVGQQLDTLIDRRPTIVCLFLYVWLAATATATAAEVVVIDGDLKFAQSVL